MIGTANNMDNSKADEKEIYPIDEWDEFMVAEHLDITKNHLVGYYFRLSYWAEKNGNKELVKEYDSKRRQYIDTRMDAVAWSEDARRALVKKWWDEINSLPKEEPKPDCEAINIES